MNDLQVRLSRCFSAVFPALCPDTILEAQSSNVENWDSVASVTLFATIEEAANVRMTWGKLARAGRI